MIIEFLCFCIYWGGVCDIYGRESSAIPYFWEMPSPWRLAIWRATSYLHCQARNYQARALA